MKQISKDMIIAEILQVDEGIAPFFLNAGLGCGGCPSAAGKTLEQAGYVHGVDIDALVDEINEYLAAS